MQPKPEGCKGCSFYSIGRGYAKPEGSPDRYKIAFIGEAPGAEEETEGRPFVGKSGWWLRSAGARAPVPGRECQACASGVALPAATARRDCKKCIGTGWELDSETCYIANTIQCRPPGNDYSKVTADVQRYCSTQHPVEPAVGSVTILVGAKALASYYPQLDYAGAMDRWRGSLIPHPWAVGSWCLPTYHPAFAMRGKPWIHPVIAGDVAGAVGAVGSGMQVLVPEVVDEVGYGKELAIDIETAADGTISMVGVSSDGEHVAQLSTDRFLGWMARLPDYVGDIYIYNAGFDVPRLESVGAVIPFSAVRDLMIAFRQFQPDAKEVGLGSACGATLPGKQLYWKSMAGLGRKKGRDREFTRQVWGVLAGPVSGMWGETDWFSLYNALDVVNTWKLGNRLRQILER